MLKAFLSLWLIFSFLSPTAAQERPDSPAAAAQGSIALAPTLGPLQQVGLKKYADPRLGVGYRYAGEPLLKADVFIYDMGLKGLGTGLKSPQVRANFEQVKADIFHMGKIGRYQSVVKLSEGETSLATAAGKIPALTATFSFAQEGEDSAYRGTRISHLLLTAYQDSLVKIRFTYPETQKAKGEQAWNQFLADFGKNLK